MRDWTPLLPKLDGQPLPSIYCMSEVAPFNCPNSLTRQVQLLFYNTEAEAEARTGEVTCPMPKVIELGSAPRVSGSKPEFLASPGCLETGRSGLPTPVPALPLSPFSSHDQLTPSSHVLRWGSCLRGAPTDLGGSWSEGCLRLCPVREGEGQGQLWASPRNLLESWGDCRPTGRVWVLHL